MDRTNESATGYTYGGQQYKKETRTDSQGNTYTVDVPTAISTAQLSQVQPLQLPTQPASPNYSGVISNAVGQVGQSSLAAQAQADALAQQEAQNQGSALSNLMAQTQAQVGNRASDVQSLYQSSGVNDLAAQLRKLNAQAQGLQLEAQAIPLQEQNLATGQNITTAAVQRNAADRLRENAIKALSIAQQSAVAQADYATAKDLADQQIAIKYDALENDLKVKQLQLQALDKYVLTPAQEKAKESRAAALQAEQTAAKIQRETETAISDVGMTLRKYGVADNVVKDVLTAKTLNEALIKAGQNLRDPKAKMELETMRLDQLLKAAEIRKVQRATELLGEKTPAQKKAELEALKNTKAAVPALEDKMILIDGILSSQAIDSVVGPTFLSRAGGDVKGIAGRFLAGAALGGAVGSAFAGVGAIPGAVVGGAALAAQGSADVFGNRQNLISSVNQLTDKAFLDELLALKERGGTLGQVTEKEGAALKNAATKIGTWEIRDSNNKVVGYNASEKDFKDEIDKIKKSTNRILTELRGTQYSADEQKLLDETFDSPLNQDASVYFQ